MELLRRLSDAWDRFERRAAHSRKIRRGIYERDPSIGFGANAAVQFRDANAWREIVSWRSIDQGTQALDAWLRVRGLSRADAMSQLRRETRADNGGEMRVLASPDLMKR